MIPYTVDRRADTGMSNVTMGVWLFLASEVMLFGALFSSYALLRVSAATWPAGRELFSWALGAANTVLLLIVTASAWRARRAGGDRLQSIALVIGVVAGIAFLVLKGIEYSGEIARGLVPAANTTLAMYYLLTGVHALHVIGGIIANLWVIAGIGRRPAALTAGRLYALSLYWLFVDVVWLVIFVLVYLT